MAALGKDSWQKLLKNIAKMYVEVVLSIARSTSLIQPMQKIASP